MWILGTGKTLRKFAVKLNPLSFTSSPIEMPKLESNEVVLAGMIDPVESMFFICTSEDEMRYMLKDPVTMEDNAIEFFTAVLDFDPLHYYDVETTEEFISYVEDRHRVPSEVVTAIKAYSFNHPHLAFHFLDLFLDRISTLQEAEDLVGIPISQYTILDAQRIFRQNPTTPADPE